MMRQRCFRVTLLRLCVIAIVSLFLGTALNGIRPSKSHETVKDVEPYGSRHLLSTVRAFNCTPAAIEQFPKPLINRELRMSGALVVHILVATIAFLGLAVVCDEYFVPSLEGICNVLGLKPDVAGATFMAAGSSAPELATSVIAVFITKDDLGVGTVVGSAVFNIMFVIGICGLYTTKALYLDWWPLTRDCAFYLVSIIALLLTIYDEVVTWYESVIFLALYASYCIFMYFNTAIERKIKHNPVFGGECQADAVSEKSQLVIYNNAAASIRNIEVNKGSHEAAEIGAGPLSTHSDDSLDSLKLQTDQDKQSVMSWPQDISRQVLWLVMLPLMVAFYVTVPDCRRHRWQRWYLITFMMSMLWLAALSYILVWMITIIGFTLEIPDTVMGLTFLAAGVSVPDAIASLLVIKDGQGDMAVSNAIGSNVFDILLCLGFPWFLQTVVVKPNSIVPVFSKGLLYSTISLFSTVVFLIIAISCNGWKLNKPLGAVLMVWYLLFMVLASLYELNIFGNFNPPTCSSDY